MTAEVNLLPFTCSDGRFYLVGRLVARLDDGGDRLTLPCPKCPNDELDIYYPNDEIDGKPFMAKCHTCKYRAVGKRAIDIWEIVQEGE